MSKEMFTSEAPANTAVTEPENDLATRSSVETDIKTDLLDTDKTVDTKLCNEFSSFQFC